ncbi:MAG: hypothetical protein IAF58_18180, partial [Leptolyngbya sp.]|nr:hypothetical protein [Candidatus Melainabacteria bacterium]
MLKRMRLKLALYFMCLFLVLHLIGATAFYILFSSSLTRSNETLLANLLSEIRPSIRMNEGRPSLADWAQRARETDTTIGATIHLFDKNGKLLEKYGPEGIDHIFNGREQEQDTNEIKSVRSRNEKILTAGKELGVLQVQVSTKQNDQA